MHIFPFSVRQTEVSAVPFERKLDNINVEDIFFLAESNEYTWAVQKSIEEK